MIKPVMLKNYPIELSILDFGESDDKDESIDCVVSYAISAENLGYKRFWMGEHYQKNTLFSNPEPLIPAIAMATDRISVGSGGLLIEKHSIERLAYSFNLLTKMFPDRIDLGLVVPGKRSDADLSRLNFKHPNEVFREFRSYYSADPGSPGIDPYCMPRPWHLTSSFEKFASCNHNYPVGVSKALFHRSTNPSPEAEQIQLLNDRYQAKFGSLPPMTIAIGCFVSDDRRLVKKYRDYYRCLFPEDVFNNLLIEYSGDFVEKIRTFNQKYQVQDIVILNLGRTYGQKDDCLSIIADLLSLKHAHNSQ